MFEQMNSQAMALGKSYSDAAIKAQSLALAGFERIADIQMKSFESRLNATVEFLSQASEVRDMEAAKSFMPKGMELAKATAEQMFATSQEVANVSIKTNEAIGGLLKGSFEMTNDSMVKQAAAVKKAASK